MLPGPGQSYLTLHCTMHRTTLIYPGQQYIVRTMLHKNKKLHEVGDPSELMQCHGALQSIHWVSRRLNALISLYWEILPFANWEIFRSNLGIFDYIVSYSWVCLFFSNNEFNWKMCKCFREFVKQLFNLAFLSLNVLYFYQIKIKFYHIELTKFT